MKRALLLFSIVLLPVFLYAASPMTQVFDGNLDEVFGATVRAAQRYWAVTSTQRNMKSFTFAVESSSRTSAVECTVMFEPLAAGQVRVTLRTVRQNRPFSWGNDEEIATKLFAAIRQELKVQARLPLDHLVISALAH